MMDLCTIGDLNWLVVLPVPRIPQWGEITMVKRDKRQLGNDAAVISLMTARLGLRSCLLPTNAIARHDGLPLIDMLQQAGVDVSLVDTTGMYTPTAFFLSCIDSDDRAAIIEEYTFHCPVPPDRVPDCTFAYIDLYEEHLGERLTFLDTWSRSHVRCLVNLSASHLEEKVSSLAHISSIDTIQMRGNGSVDEARVWGRHVLQSCNTRAVIITQGSAGAVLVDQRDAYVIPAEPVHAVRTIGAGASFTAGFISALVRGSTYHDAALFASKQAANFCSATVHPLEVGKP